MIQETKLVKTLKGANSVNFNVQGMSAVGIQISGTFVATLQLEGSIDGSNWFSLNMVNPATGVSASSLTGAGAVVGICVGLMTVRVRASSFTSGSVKVVFQTSMGSTLFSLMPGENHIGEVGGNSVIVSTEITTTASQGAYIANDAVLAAAGGVSEIQNVGRLAGGSAYITGVRLSTDKKSITPRFRVHLFNANNPTVSADNAQWQEKYVDASKRLGYIDLPAMSTGADTTNSTMSRAVDETVRKLIACAAGQTSIWFALEALDGFTPDNSEKFTLVLSLERN